jgi:hypothetical protein
MIPCNLASSNCGSDAGDIGGLTGVVPCGAGGGAASMLAVGGDDGIVALPGVATAAGGVDVETKAEPTSAGRFEVATRVSDAAPTADACGVASRVVAIIFCGFTETSLFLDVGDTGGATMISDRPFANCLNPRPIATKSADAISVPRMGVHGRRGILVDSDVPAPDGLLSGLISIVIRGASDLGWIDFSWALN